MTTADRETYEQAIRTYLEALDGIALERIVTAERWCSKWTIALDDDSRRCLVGHGSGCYRWQTAETCIANSAAVTAFMELCAVDGIARWVAAIQSYAAHLIATRAEAAVAALCGEGVTR